MSPPFRSTRPLTVTFSPLCGPRPQLYTALNLAPALYKISVLIIPPPSLPPSSSRYQKMFACLAPWFTQLNCIVDTHIVYTSRLMRGPGRHFLSHQPLDTKKKILANFWYSFISSTYFISHKYLPAYPLKTKTLSLPFDCVCCLFGTDGAWVTYIEEKLVRGKAGETWCPS